MLSPKDVKRYLGLIIDDMDSGKVPRRSSTPSWVRHLAGPAAFGFALGIGGCVTDQGGEPPIDRAAAEQAKADGFDLCWLIGEEEGCDLCEELDWYGDGICDDFCSRPDPDCGPVDCAPDGSCPDGMQCDEHDMSGCPEGAYCIMPPSPGVCRPECDSDSDCGDGQVCEGAIGECPEGAYCILAPSPGICVDAPPPPEPVDCGPDGSCPDGMQCDEYDASGCPEGAYCIMPPSPGVCRPECEDDGDCAEGETCESAVGECPEGAYCILPPTPGMCVPDDGAGDDDGDDGGCPEGAYCILPPPPE